MPPTLVKPKVRGWPPGNSGLPFSESSLTTRAPNSTATFITSQASRLHDGMGGSSQFDDKLVKFVPFQPYL